MARTRVPHPCRPADDGQERFPASQAARMRIRPIHAPRLAALMVAALAVAAIVAPSGSTSTPSTDRAVVGFDSNAELAQVLERFPGARIVRRLPHMKTVEIELPGRAEDLQGLPGIDYAHPPRLRSSKVEPALTAMFRPGVPYEWQYVATRVNAVPEDVLRAASSIKIAVVDTGLDATHPDLAAKSPETWDILHRRPGVLDRDGHGTFVSTLAAGSVTNGDGIAGFG